ncbi:hypothetical protein LJR221_001460 [Agrobacterium tumefaciens]
MTQHTPGPWSVEDNAIMAEVGAHICTVTTADDFPCLDTEARPAAELECNANAVLISASPDMFTALNEMRQQYGRLHDRLSDMIESGRVTEAALPDDYRAIVDLLEVCATADAGAEAATAKAEGR